VICIRLGIHYILIGMTRIFYVTLLVLSVMGCATHRPAPPPPLTQSDVISMVKMSVPDEEIMRRIDETRTVFRLSSEDVIRLRNEGLSDRLVSFMLDTYARAAAAEQRRRDSEPRSSFSFGFGTSFGHH
jgi:hypothetical protein